MANKRSERTSSLSAKRQAQTGRAGAFRELVPRCYGCRREMVE